MPKVNFIFKDGTKKTIEAEEGRYINEIAEENDINIPSACGGNSTCGTCHVHVGKEFFDKLNPANDDEEDTLEVVNDRNDFSRLCCQLKLTQELDGIEIYATED